MAKRDSTTDRVQDRNADSLTSLEEVIEEERTRLMLARTMLGCTSIALNNDASADQHQFVYADVIELARTMINQTTERLDSAYMRPYYNRRSIG